jgi:LysM domain
MPAWSDDRTPRSWTARVLAPLLLIAVAAAIVLVITGTLADGDDDGEPTGTNVETTESGCEPDADQAVKDGYYVVKEGDNFTTIAAKTCISVQRLQELNPNLDSFGLQPQNCVDLVADGCRALAEG